MSEKDFTKDEIQVLINIARASLALDKAMVDACCPNSWSAPDPQVSAMRDALRALKGLGLR